jgi:hypothetical protein
VIILIRLKITGVIKSKWGVSLSSKILWTFVAFVTLTALTFQNFTIVDQDYLVNIGNSKSQNLTDPEISLSFSQYNIVETESNFESEGLNIQLANPDLFRDINFDRLAEYDFNDDGINDIVDCRHSHFIRIRDGRNPRSLIYSWEGPQKIRGTDTRRLATCEVAVVEGNPVVLIGNNWRASNFWPGPALQYLIYKRGSEFVRKTLRVEDQSRNYSATVRDINCGPYPLRAVSLGHNPGALCFISTYPHNGKNFSALIKLEKDSDGNIIVKDLSPSSNIMWNQGTLGTDDWTFPVIQGFSSRQGDGKFMMSSAFFDFNGDGLVDFVTVGQHANVRAHKMVIDSNHPEGIRFETEVVEPVGNRPRYTEYLKVRALSDIDKNISLPCAYFSGEGHEGTFDHIRCYRNQRWERINIPIEQFSSRDKNASIRANGDGKILIKTAHITWPPDPNIPSVDTYFYIDYVGSFIGKSRTKLRKDSLVVRGYSCLQNSNQEITRMLTSLPFYNSNRKTYMTTNDSPRSSIKIARKCLQPMETDQKFSMAVPRAELQVGQLRSIYSYSQIGNDRPYLSNVFNYTNVGNEITNIIALPMKVFSSTRVSWNRKTTNSEYRIDLVNENGVTLFNCGSRDVIGRKLSHSMNGVCTNGRPYRANPESRIRVCSAPPGQWHMRTQVICSPLVPFHGPAMNIQF